jgi:hypothetical protein
MSQRLGAQSILGARLTAAQGVVVRVGTRVSISVAYGAELPRIATSL